MDNVYYDSFIVVSTKDVVKNSDVVLAPITALEFRMLFCFSVRNEFHHFARSVCNEFICPNRLMFDMFQFLQLLLRML